MRQVSVVEVLQLPSGLPVHVPLLDGILLVVDRLTPCKGNLHFDEIAFEIDLEGNNGHALGLNLPVEFLDLLLMGKQYPLPIPLMVEYGAVTVGLDGKADEIESAVLDDDV